MIFHKNMSRSTTNHLFLPLHHHSISDMKVKPTETREITKSKEN